jgi:MmyB-like transcription regulator ligand binding domain
VHGRLDILAASRLGYAFYSPVYDDPARPANLAQFAFLDPRSHGFYSNWDDAANTTLALLRTEARRNPYDRGLSDLVGELSTRSDQFRTRWASHNVRLHRSGAQHFHHPVVGDLSLSFEAMELWADTGLTLTAHTAEPDTLLDRLAGLLTAECRPAEGDVPATRSSDRPWRPLLPASVGETLGGAESGLGGRLVDQR